MGILRRALPGAFGFLFAASLWAAGAGGPQTADIIFLMGDRKLPEALELSQALMVSQPKNADGYYYFCLILKKMDRLASGERYFLEKLERDPDNPYWMFALACIYQLQTDYTRSLQFLESAIAREGRQPLFYDLYLFVVDVLGEENRGLAFMEGLYKQEPANYFLSSSIAELYFYQNDFKAFLRWEKLATAQNPDLLSTVLLRINRLVLDGLYDEAIRLAQEKIRLSEEAGALRDETYLLIQLGNLLIAKNEYKTGLDTINKAFNLTQIIGDETLERYVEELYAYYYSMIGYYGPALEHYQNVLRYSERARHVKMQADVLLDMGLLHEITGDYQNAFDSYNRALILAVKVQQLYLQAMALKSLADLKVRLNELDESESYYQQALKLAQRMNDPFTRCLLYYSLGALEDSKKDYPKAMAHYEESLRLAEKLHFDAQKGVIFLNMGWNLYKSGRKDQVWGKLDAAREIFRAAKDDDGIRETDYLQGVILYKEDRYQEALVFFEKAQAAASRRPAKPPLIYALTGIGRCYRKMGRLEEAVGCYRKALAMLEEMQNAMQNFEEKVRFGEDLFSYYEALIGIYGEYYRKGKDPRWQAAMFELSEKAKARNISAAIARTRLIQKLAGISPDLNLQLLLINKDLELKQREYAQKPEAAGGKAELKAEIQLLEKRRAAFLERIGREHPRFRQLLSPGLQPLDRLRKDLPPGTALLEYFVGEEETYYWVVRQDGVSSGTLGLTRDRLQQLLQDASFNLYSPKKVDFYGDYLKNQRWAGIKTRALNRLYMALMKPLERDLRGCGRLVVVPDGKLHYLPFEMLVDRITPAGDVRFLLESYEISYRPYAGSAFLSSPGSSHPAPLQNVLLIGDPTFSRQQEQQNDGRTVPISHLPYSGEEVREINSLIPDCRLFVEQDATETNFKRYATRFRVLHPSTHNYLDDRQPFYSRLVFSPDSSRGEDGSLYTYEIFNMSVSADLVVLSGCETGLGLLSRGEGIVGLSRAFMYAGASSLVVSLWPVGDRSTAGFMAEFYRNLWRGEGKAEALRQAKRMMIRDPLKRDPFFWAPFILLGDAGPLPLNRRPWYAAEWVWLVAVLSLAAFGLGLWGWYRLR